MKIYKETINNTDVIFLKTNKYKTNSIKIAFKGEFNKENASYRILLNRILKEGCSKYKTKKEALLERYKMYAASFKVSSNIQYKMNITSFSCSFIKKGPIEVDLTSDVINYMKEFILYPNIENSKFNQKVFDEAKRLEIEKIISRYDNKEIYALDSIIDLMGKDTLLSVKPYGSLETVEAISSESLYQFYLEMFKTEEISIFITGDYTLKKVQKIVQEIGIYNKVKLNIPFEIENEIKVIENQKVVEKKIFEQSILMRGYRVQNINFNDKDKYAALSFLLIYGSGPFSKLFEVVREKNSLVYDIDVNIDFSYHIMLVYAGLASVNTSKARKLIEAELEKIKKGNVSKEALNKAKHCLLSQLNSLSDNISRIRMFYEMQYFLNDNNSIKEKIKIIKDIKKEDVVRIANNIVFDSEFLLEGK